MSGVREISCFKVQLPAAAVMLWSLAAVVCAESADTIRLRESVEVQPGVQITLGDIAELTGSAAALADTPLTTAPPPGRVKNLSASLVALRLRQAGVNPRSFSIAGAAAVLLKSRAQDLVPARLAEALFDNLVAAMPWDPARTDIEIQPVRLRAALPEGEITYQWILPARWDFSGTATIQAVILVNGQAVEQIPCRVTITPLVPVAVTADHIPRGKRLESTHISWEEIPLNSRPADAVTTLEEIVGQVARRTLLKGTILTARTLDAPRIIRKNQTVSVEMNQGGVLLQTRARALADARAGDRLLCANLSSRQQFEGMVREDGLVIVTEP